MNKIYLTNDELKLIKNELSDKVSRTEKELEEKKHDSSIIEIVDEQLERRRRLIAYIDSKLPIDKLH